MPWTNPDIRLFHGTVDSHATVVLAGIDLSVPTIRSGSDFGPGFYTTTSEQQARKWSATLARQNRYHGRSPAVVFFQLSRDVVSQLETLWFVRGDSGNDAYWALIEHFRSFPRGIDHCRAGDSPWYDAVVGPVSRNWKARQAFYDADQVSFHTVRATSSLNSADKGLLA